MSKKIILTTQQDLENHAHKIAAYIVQQLYNKNIIIYLYGDLGSGKTTFSRYFIQFFGYKDKVKSPTYTLIEPYHIGDTHIYHLDLYRLSSPEECSFLGLEDILINKNTIMLIEWPEKGVDFLPNPDITLKFHNDVNNNIRSLEIINSDYK